MKLCDKLNLRNFVYSDDIFAKMVVSAGIPPSAGLKENRIATCFRRRRPEVSSGHFGDVEVVCAFGRD